MSELKIQYRFYLDDNNTEIIDLSLDEKSLESTKETTVFPEWTRLETCQCSHCPLDTKTHPHCPVAVGMIDVLSAFDHVVSYNEIDIEVITSERSVSQHTTAQRGISSLLGLLIATSGCPHTNYLKPMARFHLPLASEEETIFRAAGMYLLAQFFRQQQGKEGKLDLSGLNKIYENLHILNVSLADRVRRATHEDSSVNAVVLLDMFANIISYVLDDSLDEISHLFEPYFE